MMRVYRIDREHRREPICGPFLAEPIVTVGALARGLLALLLAGSVEERAYSVPFGEPQRSNSLKPSKSLLIDEYKVRRMD
ncbi:hypothetical protein [Bradyrhizobium sp. ERR14]|uniref:hypothetical protein n=1 Tax=Bradyrhizobium sp. ERR14 TaxID=2663837 RepID=UPI001614B3B9|nr:hypothetical protein [Bradyrhizobium sp. ERR14]MBB4396195.1 hypothetical protein [Bradyrhizobium sp. ERR14]